jgi:hypothetical protein
MEARGSKSVEWEGAVQKWMHLISRVAVYLILVGKSCYNRLPQHVCDFEETGSHTPVAMSLVQISNPTSLAAQGMVIELRHQSE